jgi:hypothetical protein
MITRQQQEEAGLLPVRAHTYVPASPRRDGPNIPTRHEVSLDVAHPAQQIVHVNTSAVDRAKGYQIVITPLAVALGVVAVIVSMAFENEFFSFASFVFFWLTFVLAWLAGWIVTALATPEFVSWYSAKRQWNHIDREQEERWAHYKWVSGRNEDE